jgi:hypothetical protein
VPLWMERAQIGFNDDGRHVAVLHRPAMHAAELYDDHQNCGIQAAAAKYLGAEAGFDALAEPGVHQQAW